MTDWNAPGALLLVSCYELGHQPLGIATPAAALRRAGFQPGVLDVSVAPLDAAAIEAAQWVGISVPMHTALQLGVQVARQVRERNPAAHLCFFGLYAELNRELLGELADTCLSGEIEDALVELVTALAEGRDPQAPEAPLLRRLDLPPPRRDDLPPLARYARLEHGGAQVLAGAVESSRGCKHLCRHCPIPPVYGGRFFAVPQQTVLSDVDRLVDLGAGHVTFADPDFLNGPTHALRIARAVHDRYPQLTFDFTAKVEHLLRHRDAALELGALGCVFVVSAVESLSDEVLSILDKGHTRADVFSALALAREAGFALRPSLLPFTPWSTREDYLELLEVIVAQDLVGHVDPVQLSIRLLIPPGSLLLETAALRPHLGACDPKTFSWTWTHPDPGMDALQREVGAVVESAARAGCDARETLGRIRILAGAGAVPMGYPERGRPPRLTESWFC